MYNRYISARHGEESFVPATSPQLDNHEPLSFTIDRPGPAEPQAAAAVATDAADAADAVAAAGHKSLLGGLFGGNLFGGNLFGKRDGKTGLLDGLFGGFFKDLDIGDIILILILILLVIEGDELDLLISIGLILLLGV